MHKKFSRYVLVTRDTSTKHFLEPIIEHIDFFILNLFLHNCFQYKKNVVQWELLYDYAKVLGVSKKDAPFEFNARSLPMTVVSGDSKNSFQV